MEPTYCSQCGERRESGKAFCANCGRAFNGTSNASAESDLAKPVQASALNRLRGADVAILGGAALLIVSPFFPFLSATAAFVGSISRSGVEITNGEALVLSAVGVIAGLVALRSLGGRKSAGLVLLGIVGIALTFYYFIQVDERVRDVGSEAAIASIGAGIWTAFAGAALVAIGALTSIRAKPAG